MTTRGDVQGGGECMQAVRRRTVHKKRTPTTPRLSAGADNRKFSQIIGVALPEVVDDKLTETYRQVTDTSPLPPDFDYAHMFESYVWRAIFLTSFTLGIRFGNIDAVSGIFLGILGSTIVFIITYICVPGGILYVDKKVEKKQLTIEERRVMLIGAAAFLGVLGSAVNQHYVIKEGTAPSYFLPGLVGLTVQVAGPHLGQHRIPFLAVSVGTAFMIGVMIMAYADDLGFGTLFSLTISAICATINLQILVAAIIQHKVDMMSSHVVAVLMALYQHLLFSRLLGEYNEEEKSTPSITNPILYS